MPIKFYCQKCGQRLSIDSKRAGKSVSCPSCHRRILIPFESEARRTETTAQETQQPEPSTVADQEEQNRLLDDLDDFGPLGESWDELLESDWEQGPAIEEVVSPSVKDQTADEILTHEKQEAPQKAEPPPEKPAVPPVAQPTAQSVPPKPVQVAPVDEEEPPVEEVVIKTQVTKSAATPSADAFLDEDDDDDDDDGFSIRSAESDFEEMDLTPMVDVTFLLLIFFMITASFSLQKSIQVPPPNPDEDGVSQSLQTLDDFREESIIVEIDNNNGIYVDDTKLSNPADIVQAILDRRNQDGKPKSELVLSAHKAARHETVVAVVDAANEVGMQKIRLASYRGPED